MKTKTLITDIKNMNSTIGRPSALFINSSNLIKSVALFVCLSQSSFLVAAGDAIDPASGNAVPSVPEIASQGYKLAFSDEFKGPKLDEDKWQYRTDSKGSWAELPANVTVSNGLHIAVNKDQSQAKEVHSGGGIISKAEFQYGYYEARFKGPAAGGWHTSFFTMHYNGKDAGNTSGREEIDICLQDSQLDTWGYKNTLHDWGAKLPDAAQHAPNWIVEPGHAPPHIRPDDPDYFKEAHIWGMEFTPKVVRFYFDGEWVGTMDATWFAHTPMSVWLTTAPADLVPVDDSQLPSEAQFDYFRFFTKPGSQP